MIDVDELNAELGVLGIQLRNKKLEYLIIFIEANNWKENDTIWRVSKEKDVKKVLWE